VSGPFTVSKVTVDPVNTQRVGVAFTVTCSLAFSGDNPVTSLQYADGSGPMRSIYVTAVMPDIYTLDFVHPGYATPGTYQVTVGAGGVSGISNKFKVVPK
jgi:hypothetical protein